MNKPADAQPDTPPLQTTAQDTLTSLFLALITMLGAAVLLLGVAWLGGRVLDHQVAVPIQIAETAGGSRDGIAGESRQLADVDVSDLAASDLIEPEVGQTMATLLDAVAQTEAALGSHDVFDSSGASAGGGQGGSGNRAALGEGEGTGGFPRAQRWEIHFAPGASLAEYARQLDFFRIELGLIGLGNEVTYCSEFSAAKPRVRSGSPGEEQRLYMSWQRGPLVEADRSLVRKAGLNPTGKVLVQFYPADVENTLALLEREFAGREAAEILRTRFGVRAAGNGYSFYVLEQTPLETSRR